MSGSTTTLGMSSKATLGLLGGILATALAGTWRFATWSAIVDLRLKDIEHSLDEVLSERWTAYEIEMWLEALRRANPALIVPDSPRQKDKNQ